MDEAPRHHRHRDQGDVPNESVRSLLFSLRFDSLRKDTDIVDERGEVVYHSTSRPISLKDKTDVTDARGTHVAHIERRVLSPREYHRVEMASGRTFDVACELPNLARDVVNIHELGWQLRGNIVALDFEIKDETGRAVAVVGQGCVTATDRHRVDIHQEAFEAEVVAIIIVLQHTMHDRETTPLAHTASSPQQA